MITGCAPVCCPPSDPRRGSTNRSIDMLIKPMINAEVYCAVMDCTSYKKW